MWSIKSWIVSFKKIDMSTFVGSKEPSKIVYKFLKRTELGISSSSIVKSISESLRKFPSARLS
ncbi:MAG: hypothetical protein L6V90_03485 [Treponema succinifaciens]|nr:MAG: hypothetical protein L6V90_03485 [Treponema succinifaciens]